MERVYIHAMLNQNGHACMLCLYVCIECVYMVCVCVHCVCVYVCVL